MQIDEKLYKEWRDAEDLNKQTACQHLIISSNETEDDYHSEIEAINVYENEKADFISSVKLSKKPKFIIDKYKQIEDVIHNNLEKDVWVWQTQNGGYTGDSFAGFKAYKIKQKNLYLIFKYEC